MPVLQEQKPAMAARCWAGVLCVGEARVLGPRRAGVTTARWAVGGAIAVGGFELVPDEAVCGEREALFGDRGARDVAGEAFEFVALPGFGGDAGV